MDDKEAWWTGVNQSELGSRELPAKRQTKPSALDLALPSFD